MIRWPWVSRLAFEIVSAERDRLVTECQELREHLRRTDRVMMGLGEVPRERRPALDPMPASLTEKIKGWGTNTIQIEQAREAWRRRIKGEQWTTIERDMFPPAEAESGLQADS